MFFVKPPVTSFIIPDSNERVKIGNSVVVRKSPEEEEGVYIALVANVHKEKNGLRIVIKRYYTPEETLGGRMSFHGKKELLLTSDLESIGVHSIERKCFVHSFSDYTRLIHVGPYDYFSRFEYQTGSGTLVPDQISVFCNCNMPFNPDEFMLKCQDCKERYHPACINMTDAEAKQIDRFTCDECHFVDPDILKALKQELEELARTREELAKAAEEHERAAEEAAEQAREAKERERAAKERQQVAEERQRAAQKRLKELEERVKESANKMITLKAPPSPPQNDDAKQIDSFRSDECRSLDINQASVSASTDPDMVQPDKRAKW